MKMSGTTINKKIKVIKMAMYTNNLPKYTLIESGNDVEFMSSYMLEQVINLDGFVMDLGWIWK